MTLMPVFIAAVLLLAAVFLLLKAREQRRLGGLPDGELIYSDNLAEDCPVLVSHRYGLKGKPDALVRTDSGDLIPVERKKALAPRHGPYDGDLIQATAYCILVEEESGRTPPFMRIQYADRWFDEPYTPERKRWVLEACAQLRQTATGPTELPPNAATADNGKTAGRRCKGNPKPQKGEGRAGRFELYTDTLFW